MTALDGVRDRMAEVECGFGCTAEQHPVEDWTIEDCAIGPCCVCGEPCRSRDGEGRMRHITCKLDEGEG